MSARCVNAQKPARLFVLRAQNLAGLRVHQMRLSARKAGHLDASEVIVFGVIGGPSLEVVAGIGAAVLKRRHAERTEV
jgi:hypothetical protein